MDGILPYVYLTYMFISLYMLSFFIIIYFGNRKQIFFSPEPEKNLTVSFLIAAWNEEATISETIKHIFNTGYNKIVEVIVIDNNSTDRTREIVKKLQKKYPKLKLVQEKKQGKGHALNYGLKIAKGELIAVVDADSYPAKGSIGKMMGFFNDKKVGAVTAPITVRNPSTFFSKLQSIEYKVIAFSRKLLDYVDSIYVTPGPLALYRKKALEDIGGFDANNLTEDIEATWHLTYAGWERRMCLSTEATTTVPKTLKGWFVQRRRWNLGGLQCLNKYKTSLGRKGMLGWFIMPFFILNTFMGLIGLGVFAYLFGKRIFSKFLLAKYSILVGTPMVTLNDFYLTPSVLNYLGVVLFVVGLIFTLMVLSILNEKILKKENILNIPFYMTIYLIIYPFIMLSALWHVVRRKRVWR